MLRRPLWWRASGKVGQSGPAEHGESRREASRAQRQDLDWSRAAEACGTCKRRPLPATGQFRACVDEKGRRVHAKSGGRNIARNAGGR